MNILLECSGGKLTMPALPLLDRADGGHLWVNPPRSVWERSELTAIELTHWSFLIAASGQAMLDTLEQLKDGCINYWEAGNWALNPAASPMGSKYPRTSRQVHMHLLGRSRHAKHLDWQWGESPRFPDYCDAKKWAGNFKLLNDEECNAITARAIDLLRVRYGIETTTI